MNRVLFSNHPWWVSRGPTGVWRAGIRAGSRWPFTQDVASRPDLFAFGDYLPYPMFMGFAAAWADEHRAVGDSVVFRDSIALRESYDRFFDHVATGEYTHVVIETATPSWDHDAHLIRHLNAMCPDMRIIVCGPITTTRGDEILARNPVFACVRGEYEKGVMRALGGQSGIIDFDLLTTDEMMASPPPFMDHTYAWRYWDACPVGQQYPQLQTWSSRGCPYKCVFCAWPATMTGADPDGTHARRVRYYSPGWMEEWVMRAVRAHGFRCIYDDSDTFNLGTSHTEAMCAVYRKTGVPWFAMCRADTIKRETWGLMRESGCRGVKIGFESGSQFVVDKIIGKHLDLEEAAAVVQHCASIGLAVHGTFSFGAPGETREQMQETFAYIERLRGLGMTSYQTSGMAVIDGTPLDTLGAAGKLAKYPGADGAGYRRETDGNVKMQRLALELRES